MTMSSSGADDEVLIRAVVTAVVTSLRANGYLQDGATTSAESPAQLPEAISTNEPREVDTASVDVLLLTVAQAARRLNLGRSSLFELVRRGDIASVCVGRSRRIPTEALNEYVDRLREAAARDSHELSRR